MSLAQHHVEIIAKALRALLACMILAALAFALYQLAPVYTRNYEFQDAARREARLASANMKSGPAIQEDIYQKAQEIGVPVEIQAIKVETAATESHVSSLDSMMDPTAQAAPTGIVEIEVSYAVPVRFPGYTLQLQFHIHADDRDI